MTGFKKKIGMLAEPTSAFQCRWRSSEREAVPIEERSDEHKTTMSKIKNGARRELGDTSVVNCGHTPDGQQSTRWWSSMDKLPDRPTPKETKAPRAALWQPNPRP